MSQKTTKQNIDAIAAESFLNYSTEVIKERAISNIEDNMKPVHRRIIHTMWKEKLHSTAKPKKAAATVGEVMKIHPHGDSSIYDALVRLSQDFKMRYPLVEIHGNGGNINGSPAAAMRYTEARLSPIGDYMVQEINEKAVMMKETYDGDAMEPVLLPSAFPNILANGNMGIAVGMSSSIQPHNLKEAVDAIIATIDNPLLTTKELIKIMPGPDLPTGGIITNSEKILDIYESGSGTLELEGKYTLETKGRSTHIVFTEIPYLVTTEAIVGKIKELAAEGLLDDIHDLQNNTGRSGLEIRIILKPNANANRVLNILFDKTQLRNNIRFGTTVLEGGKPVQTNMLGLIKGYIRHRHQVIFNIYTEKKRKAEERLHVVDGLVIAVQDIDGVVAKIKASASTAAARETLMKDYNLTEIQARAILNMRLSQLTRMDATALKDEQSELNKNIAHYSTILKSETERNRIIKKELAEVKNKFGDARRTILRSTSGVDDERFVEIDYLVGLNENGSLNAAEISSLMHSKKGRVGKKIFDSKSKKSIQLNNRNKLVVADDEGRIYSIPGARLFAAENIRVEELDPRTRNRITSIVELSESDENKEFLITFSKDGTVKKTALSEYKDFSAFNIGVKLRDGDEVASMFFANDDDYIVAFNPGRINKYKVSEIRATGRNTIGVKASDSAEGAHFIVGSDTDKVLFYGADTAKSVMIKDITEGIRTAKGITINEDSTKIGPHKRESLVIIGSDGRGYLLEQGEIELKNIKHTNNKIYSGQILELVA